MFGITTDPVNLKNTLVSFFFPPGYYIQNLPFWYTDILLYLKVPAFSDNNFFKIKKKKEREKTL